MKYRSILILLFLWAYSIPAFGQLPEPTIYYSVINYDSAFSQADLLIQNDLIRSEWNDVSFGKECFRDNLYEKDFIALRFYNKDLKIINTYHEVNGFNDYYWLDSILITGSYFDDNEFLPIFEKICFYKIYENYRKCYKFSNFHFSEIGLANNSLFLKVREDLEINGCLYIKDDILKLSADSLEIVNGQVESLIESGLQKRIKPGNLRSLITYYDGRIIITGIELLSEQAGSTEASEIFCHLPMSYVISQNSIEPLSSVYTGINLNYSLHNDYSIFKYDAWEPKKLDDSVYHRMCQFIYKIEDGSVEQIINISDLYINDFFALITSPFILIDKQFLIITDLMIPEDMGELKREYWKYYVKDYDLMVYHIIDKKFIKIKNVLFDTTTNQENPR